MSKIHIPTPLRQYVGKQASVEVQGATVGEAMNSLVAQHPELRKHLYTDEGKLRAFVNLYLNAIDAMPEGGQLRVEAKIINSDSVEPVMLISVADTGFGIEEKDLEKIFQPFFTAKKRRGMGLGLPLCQRIAKNHGGRIEVESQPGKGTTFKIYLPLNNSPITESVPRQESPTV